LDSKIQALTVKETTSKVHMQVHTNKESREKQPGKKPGPNRAWADRTSPFRARFDAIFDLDVLQTIYSTVVKSHEEIHSSFAAEERRREGHHPGEERVEMVD
jgi:chloramphenicol 3-O-phosphotransferase